MLPRDFNDLPARKLDLSPAEDELLSAEVHREMSVASPQSLKDAYLQLAAADAKLDGIAEFIDVERALAKNRIVLPPQLLKLVAARCLSSHVPDKVNYERLISFLGAARASDVPHTPGHHGPETANGGAFHAHRHAHSPQASVRSYDGRGYYQDDGPLDSRSHRSHDFSGERPGLAGVLRELKAHRGFRNLNLNSLRSSFQQADSLHRGALSEQQIKDVCAHCGLVLDDGLAWRVIRMCPNKGGGQYDWQEFLRILERVLPQATGLFIPRSRRPNEMAKLPMEASSEWPYGSNAFTPRGPAMPSHGSRSSSQAGHAGGLQPLYREASPEPARHRSELYSQRQYRGPDPEFLQLQQQYEQEQQQQQKQQYEQQQQQQYLQQQQQQQYLQQQQQQQYLQQQQQQQYLQQQQQQEQQEQKYQQRAQQEQQQQAIIEEPTAAQALLSPKENIEDIKKVPWVNRFVRLADACYIADTNKSGHLDLAKAQRLVNDYDTALGLELRGVIDQALERSTKTATGRVDISVLLRLLGASRC